MADLDTTNPPMAGTAAPMRWAAPAIVAGAALLLAAAVALWARYGTAVFFEMIAAGIAACF